MAETIAIRDLKEDLMASKDELEKQAAREEQRRQELDAWGRWKQDRNGDDFKFLLDSYRPFLQHQGRRYFQSGTLPPAVVQADLVQNFHRALETYDPNKGAQLNTHIGSHLRHTGRLLRTYNNIGKIPEPRARQIAMFESRNATLSDRYGRPPSAAELADDMGIDQKDVELLRVELRRDLIMDDTPGGLGVEGEMSPMAMQNMEYLHGELSGEQQSVLEHTYGLRGAPMQRTNEDIARVLNMTPQRVRAIKRQIARRYEKRYG